MVPAAIVLGIVGLSVIGLLVTGHIFTGLLSGTITYFIAKAVAFVVNSLILPPMRIVRYKNAAKAACEPAAVSAGARNDLSELVDVVDLDRGSIPRRY